MKLSSARKATGMVVTAVAILALAVGSTFAGTSFSNGANKLDNSGNNYKNGTYHKNDGSCPTYYESTQSFPSYDLNQDTWECILYAADGSIDNITDNTSH
jgi:hypothetical protein